MALNFLSVHVYGGGPAHLLLNPARRQCALIAVYSVIVSTTAFSSMLYAKYYNASYGGEVHQYLFMLAIANFYTFVYFGRLAAMRLGSDGEWSRILVTMGLINIFNYCLIIWGFDLCYRVFQSKAIIGSNMYYYFRVGKWMYNTIIGISAFSCYCIIYTTYVALVKILVSLVYQRSKKKYAI